MMHFTKNKIENNHDFEKYEWQKPHQPNLTGTKSAYYPNKNKDAIEKKYKSLEKLKFYFLFLIFSLIFSFNLYSDDNLEGQFH